MYSWDPRINLLLGILAGPLMKKCHQCREIILRDSWTRLPFRNLCISSSWSRYNQLCEAYLGQWFRQKDISNSHGKNIQQCYSFQCFNFHATSCHLAISYHTVCSAVATVILLYVVKTNGKCPIFRLNLSNNIILWRHTMILLLEKCPFVFSF